MTHPDYCKDLNSETNITTEKGTSRLALCTHLVRAKTRHDHTKSFRQFPKGPSSILTPHHIIGNPAAFNRTLGLFFHFTSKYGCTPDPKRLAQCKPPEMFKEPAHLLALQELERRLQNYLVF
mmetsp:Transcript_14082/g.16095  ORF Transcript_14082/g.16095 Transcript_14082/m.16095 type:complete len:122 (-) Transcript_14082:244-609(-)